MDGSSCEERGLISNPFIIPNNLESGVQWVLEKLLIAQHIKPSAKWIIANAMLSKESSAVKGQKIKYKLTISMWF